MLGGRRTDNPQVIRLVILRLMSLLNLADYSWTNFSSYYGLARLLLVVCLEVFGWLCVDASQQITIAGLFAWHSCHYTLMLRIHHNNFSNKISLDDCDLFEGCAENVTESTPINSHLHWLILNHWLSQPRYSYFPFMDPEDCNKTWLDIYNISRSWAIRSFRLHFNVTFLFRTKREYEESKWGDSCYYQVPGNNSPTIYEMTKLYKKFEHQLDMAS